MTLRRRTLLAAAPAAAAAGALAACGSEEEEPSKERDVQLLSDALAGEENAASALDAAGKAARGEDATTIAELRAQASANAARLQKELEQLGATAEENFKLERSNDLETSVTSAIEQTNRAVTAYRLGAGQLSTEALRKTAIELITLDGARLALLNGVLGKDEAPNAFVTGKDERPLQYPGGN